MSAIYWKMVRLVAILLTLGFLAGCAQQGGLQSASTNLAPEIDLGPTIGSLAQVTGPQEVAVEGYGLVGGLAGTGSSQCPPRVREYLRKYIATQLPNSTVDINKLIDSDTTAVVWLESVVPSATTQRNHFDVRVGALSGTQTTSLEEGWLYTAELWPRGAIGISGKPLGTVEGPVFIDMLSLSEPDMRQGYVLGGGNSASDYKITLLVNKPDFRVAATIRNKLNERFGFGNANAISAGRIELNVPESYKGQELKFVEIVRATYLEETPEITRERIKTYVTRLATTADKHDSEIALEAIGKESLTKLAVLLNSSDQQVRLSAGRCMLNLGSDRGVPVLKKIAMDPNSPYRIEVLEALSRSPNRADALEVAVALLRDRSLSAVLGAYEQLRRLNDPMVVQEYVARSFFIDKVPQMPQKAIYIARSGQPRIVLFGAPIYCRGGFSVQSKDGNIMIDHRSGQEYVSVARKHPMRSIVIGPIMTTLDLSDIIKILCEEPAKVEQGRRNGLGVSYDDMVALVKQMCEKDIITAEFWVGPLPEIAAAVKK